MMPGGDGTGPYGTGGWCTPLWQSGQIPTPVGLESRDFYRRGFRSPGGGGRGRGRMNMYYATGLPGWIRYQTLQQPPLPMQQSLQPTREQELQYLEQEANVLEQELSQVKKRIEELRE